MNATKDGEVVGFLITVSRRVGKLKNKYQSRTQHHPCLPIYREQRGRCDVCFFINNFLNFVVF